MKLITRETDYAIKILLFFAKSKNKKVSAKDLVKEIKLARPILRKIMQNLSRNGLLKSYKGKDGGFCLAVSPGKIMLADLMEIFQGPLKINECLFNREVCPDRKKCVLKEKIDSIENHIVKELSKITMESLINDAKISR